MYSWYKTFGRDGLPLSYGQFAQSASADPYTNCSYESFRMGKSRSPDPYVNCPYDCKVVAVSTNFRRCEGLTGRTPIKRVCRKGVQRNDCKSLPASSPPPPSRSPEPASPPCYHKGTGTLKQNETEQSK